jgi:signal transduction histidine kinase
MTLPSGLEVSINLSDGQVIPSTGYTVTITPLNGVGNTFDHVEIYIDNQLVTTVRPDDTGTAHWDWDTQKFSGENVKIVIFDTDGKSVSHTFHVTIGKTGSGNGNITNTQSGGSTNETATNPIQRFIERTYHSAETFVKKLPKPIIYSFPYILFVLLGVVIFILLLQVKRELSEYESLLVRLDREKVAKESKRTLMELVAHYLRTPLTIIRGGIDMLQEASATTVTATILADITKHLQTNIELVIEQMHAVDTNVIASSKNANTQSSAPWRQPGLYAPLLLIAVVVFSFDYLAEQSDRLTASQVIFATHIIIYSTLAVVLYQVFRRLQLRRRDTAAIKQLVIEQQATNHTRDTIVDSALALIEGHVSQLDSTAASLPSSAASQFIQDGRTRFHELLTNFKVATTLRGSHNTEPLVPMSATDLIRRAMDGLQPKADAKNITIDIKSSDSTPYPIPSPELMTFVLHTSLDNAIAYSPEQSTIGVVVAASPSGIVTTITDHGLGITADKQAYLFQPFSKAEGAETFTHEGMGFSLYLARLIMTYVDGSIELTSAPNQGTVVTIHIPVKTPNEKELK